jgi:hypothetical protein
MERRWQHDGSPSLHRGRLRFSFLLLQFPAFMRLWYLVISVHS